MISNNSHYISGRKKFEQKDFSGALEDYNKAIQQEENPAIYSERAVVFYYLDQKDKSLADMNYAAELEPDNPYRYSSRAYIKDSMGDLEGAIADYEIAIKLDPDDAIAHNNLGLLQEKMGYKDKAKHSLNRADTLAQVDQLLDEIRKEKGYEIPTEKEDRKPSTEEQEALGIWTILRNTFFTKTGFKEYLNFIKDGFKIKG